MSRTKFRVSEPCGGIEEVSMCSVPPVGGAWGSQHHARNVFCKYKAFYQKKKKLSQEPGLFLDFYCVSNNAASPPSSCPTP